MEQLINKENNINFSNKQSNIDTSKNSMIFFNKGNFFSFGKENIVDNKIAPNTSSFNIRESFKKPIDIKINDNNSFLNKKRKLMTSEELELEQIQREREEVKKMMKKNMDLYNRTKSGTTTIVSKVRDTIYGLNNLSKNNNINNNINVNKTSGYTMNFLKEKAINKINELNKKIKENNIKQEKLQQQPNMYKGKTIEIINTDILPENNISNNNVIEDKKNIIELNEEKEDNENIEQEVKIEHEDYEVDNKEKSSTKKTPVKESSYLSKIKQLGSMSKLSLCNKIQKYILDFINKVKQGKIKRDLHTSFPPKYKEKDGLINVIGRSYDKDVIDNKKNVLILFYDGKKEDDINKNYKELMIDLSEKYLSDDNMNIVFEIIDGRVNEPRDITFDNIDEFPLIYLYTNSMKDKKNIRFVPQDKNNTNIEEIEKFIFKNLGITNYLNENDL